MYFPYINIINHPAIGVSPLMSHQVSQGTQPSVRWAPVETRNLRASFGVIGTQTGSQMSAESGKKHPTCNTGTACRTLNMTCRLVVSTDFKPSQKLWILYYIMYVYIYMYWFNLDRSNQWMLTITTATNIAKNATNFTLMFFVGSGLHWQLPNQNWTA